MARVRPIDRESAPDLEETPASAAEQHLVGPMK